VQLQKCEKLFCGVLLLLFVAGWVALLSIGVCVPNFKFWQKPLLAIFVWYIPAGAQVPSKADVVDCN